MGDLLGFFRRARDAVLRLPQFQLVQQLLEPLAILGEIDRIR